MIIQLPHLTLMELTLECYGTNMLRYKLAYITLRVCWIPSGSRFSNVSINHVLDLVFDLISSSLRTPPCSSCFALTSFSSTSTAPSSSFTCKKQQEKLRLKTRARFSLEFLRLSFIIVEGLSRVQKHRSPITTFVPRPCSNLLPSPHTYFWSFQRYVSTVP